MILMVTAVTPQIRIQDPRISRHTWWIWKSYVCALADDTNNIQQKILQWKELINNYCNWSWNYVFTLVKAETGTSGTSKNMTFCNDNDFADFRVYADKWHISLLQYIKKTLINISKLLPCIVPTLTTFLSGTRKIGNIPGMKSTCCEKYSFEGIYMYSMGYNNFIGWSNLLLLRKL